MKEKRLDSSKNVRSFYAAGDLEDGQRRATDPVWSLKVYGIEKTIVNVGEPLL